MIHIDKISKVVVITFLSLVVGLPVTAQNVPEGYFPLSPGVTLATGDTWQSQNETYRLYGVQSCLRGTFYTNLAGEQVDCGETSLAVFAAYIKDTKPLCAKVANIEDINFVSCFAAIGPDRLDLGTILISQGFAFASLDRQGIPVHPPYLATEQYASEQRSGLWTFNDVQHPAVLIATEWNRRNK